MSNHLAVSDIYVKVRLHKEPRRRSTLDIDEQRLQDPLSIMQQKQLGLERRSSSAVDPAMALKQYKRCIVLGDPGAGKTTLLKRLAVQASEGKLSGLPALPIYIKLQEAAQAPEVDLFAMAVQAFTVYGLPQAQVTAFLEQRMHNGEVLLLLDALDETVVGETLEAGEASYKRIVEAIVHLSRRYSKVPVVITARKAGYIQRGQLVGFTELEVLDFLPQEIEQFITKWFQHYGDARRNGLATKLIATLKQRPRLATLAANPLLLTLIVIAYEENAQQLPESRAQLYQQCIETLLTRWDGTRYIERAHSMNSADQKKLLPQIAWYFHNQGLRYFPEVEMLTLITGFLSELGCGWRIARYERHGGNCSKSSELVASTRF